MNLLNSTISNHQKDQHLVLQDHVIIQILRKQGKSQRQIAIYHGQSHRYWTRPSH